MSYRKFRVIKPEIRVLGVDDGAFTPHKKGFVPVVGVVFRGGYWLEGVMHTQVEVDGFDATIKISDMVIRSSHHRQLRVIMLNGITFAGFNIIDIKELFTRTSLPVIAVTKEKPDLKEIDEALKKLPGKQDRLKALKNAGEIYPVSIHGDAAKIYMQISGILKDDAVKILQQCCTRSNIPEALRVAHLIASGISTR